jgi:ATP-dependent 26S proteasome regulatory subunit
MFLNCTNIYIQTTLRVGQDHQWPTITPYTTTTVTPNNNDRRLDKQIKEIKEVIELPVKHPAQQQ